MDKGILRNKIDNLLPVVGDVYDADVFKIVDVAEAYANSRVLEVLDRIEKANDTNEDYNNSGNINVFNEIAAIRKELTQHNE